MSTQHAKPSLRISHVVYGRHAVGRRVTYLVDPRGNGDERAIPEQVVLTRWRRRRFPGYTFSGERLSSTVWRALPALLGRDVVAWFEKHQQDLESRRRARAANLRQRHLTLPSAGTMVALFQTFGAARLERVVARHEAPDRRGRSGVPDLFLFARDVDGNARIARFVEVKKPEEPVSEDQLSEIGFLNELGVHARVLRLVERRDRR